MTKLFKYFKKYIWLILITMALILSQSFSELSLPANVAKIIDIGVASRDTGYIWQRMGYMLGIVAIVVVCAVLVGYLSSIIAGGVAKDLRFALFNKVIDFSQAEIDKFGISSLITRTTNDITQIQNFTVILLRIIVMAPAMCIGGIVMAYITNKRLTIYVLMAMPLVVGGIFLISRKAIPMFESIQGKLDNLNLIIRENITGMRVIKAFIKTDHEIDRFSKANSDLTDTSIKVQRIMGSLMPVLTLIMNITAVTIMWVGGNSVAKGSMEVGMLVSYIQYVMQIMGALAMLSMIFVMLPRAIVSANRINEVLATDFSIVDGEKTLNEQPKDVEFNNVTFCYPNATEPVLKNITFTAKSGETTAFIGSTGSGKSTVVKLIPRFYDATEGDIKIGGINIKNLTLDSLRKAIGYVPQSGLLFSGSIESNLKFGKKDATIDEMTEITKIAQSYNFIKHKQGEFASPIAQGGNNVSGGQKQRISIARALMKDADVLIFDDSFSALDYKTDKALRTALKEKTENKATLIVAQRITTVIDADKIICLDDGEIVGIGTHKQLLHSCQIYKEIAQSQLTKEELAL